jgi:hypothetical protein
VIKPLMHTVQHFVLALESAHKAKAYLLGFVSLGQSMVKSTALLELLSKNQAHTINALSQAATLKRSSNILKKGCSLLRTGPVQRAIQNG